MAVATAVVTGSQSGPGPAIRDALARRGFTVLGVDRPGTGAEIPADLGTAEGRGAAASGVLAATGGRLDAVAACAGVEAPRPDLVFAVNYLGVVDLLGRLRPALAAGGDARVAVLLSNAAFVSPGIPPAAVQALLDGNPVRAARLLEAQPALAPPVSWLAVSRWIRESAPGAAWAGAGISMNGVCPGPIAVPAREGEFTGPRRGPALRRLPRPLGALATADDVAGVVEFLLAGPARFLVGQVLCMDGGTEALLRAGDWPRAWDIELPTFRRLVGG